MRLFYANARLALLLLSSSLAAQSVPAVPAPEITKKLPSGTTTVEVINGTSRRTVILQPNKQNTAKRRKQSKQPKQRFITADILNGTQKQTRTFRIARSASAPTKKLSPLVIGIETTDSKNPHGKPVVVGISSELSSARPVVLNVASNQTPSAHPVVIGVASSGSQTAGTVEHVAVGVSPRPAKRPPYRPAALDHQ